MGGCSAVGSRRERSSTAAVQMERWSGNAGARRGEHTTFVEVAWPGVMAV
jgi:hypothetical protein